VRRSEIIAITAVFGLAVVALVMRLVDVPGQMVFPVAALAVTGLAWVLGEATEHAGESTGPRASALLNASFGNLPELVILVLAIREGLDDIARASIIGSVIGNILLILGLALLLGGLKNGVQRFNANVAALNTSMLMLAVAGLGIPTLLFALDPSTHDVAVLSRWTAVLLLGSYVAYLVFQFRTPGLEYTHLARESHWTRRQAVALLAATAVATGVVSEVLVHSIEPTIEEWGVPREFIGLIVVPFVGNVAEHFAAVRLAYRNNVDFAFGIAFGSAVQIALGASALAVVASILLGDELSLVFPSLEFAALAGAALVATLVARGGESNWLEGLQLLVIYVLFGVAFWEIG
jgi:Ca2+:H+ antiporter